MSNYINDRVYVHMCVSARVCDLDEDSVRDRVSACMYIGLYMTPCQVPYGRGLVDQEFSNYQGRFEEGNQTRTMVALGGIQ